MKRFIVLALLITLAFADHHENHHSHDHEHHGQEKYDHEHEIKSIDEIKKARKDCMDELKLSDEDRESLGKYEFPDRESIHKYVYCTSVKLDFFDDAHGFHLDHIVDQIGQNKNKAELHDKIEKCLDKNEQKSSVELWAYRNYKCMHDAKLFEEVRQSVLADH